jgi:hypothetical protein
MYSSTRTGARAAPRVSSSAIALAPTDLADDRESRRPVQNARERAQSWQINATW